MNIFQDLTEKVHVSTKVCFDPKSPCRKIWEDLMEDGKLVNKIGILSFRIAILFSIS